MKIIINTCFGGFSFSQQAVDEYNRLKPVEVPEATRWEDNPFRTDPLMIEVVERLGSTADGDCAELKIIEIPDGIQWHVEEYDGREHIAEDHRCWS